MVSCLCMSLTSSAVGGMQGWQSSNISQHTGIDMEVLERGPSGKAKQSGLSRETFIKKSQIMHSLI